MPDEAAEAVDDGGHGDGPGGVDVSPDLLPGAREVEASSSLVDVDLNLGRTEDS